eukprot:Nitzschia sp. Nitz4//scaffold40_size135432//95979//97508//NITZ4_003258-RA/size135432-processed-gene-0.74-mRNA-1//-1//CDS//3329551261//731//frame0
MNSATSTDEAAVQKPKLIDQPPSDDIGNIRERRAYTPLQLPLRHILPNPCRDQSFSPLTGWRYYPTSYKEDRLCISFPPAELPETSMAVPAAWSTQMGYHPKMRQPSASTTKPEDWESDKRPEIQVQDSASAKKSRTPVTATIHTTLAQTQLSNLTLETKPSPALPSDCTDLIPKTTLYGYYGKKLKTTIKPSEHYVSWSNGKPSNYIRYSSAFFCPVTNFVFLSGQYGDNFEHEGEIIWFAKKNIAEQAAAAKALDYWMYKDGNQGVSFCHDDPVPLRNTTDTPWHIIPRLIHEKFRRALEERMELEGADTQGVHEPSKLSTQRNTMGFPNTQRLQVLQTEHKAGVQQSNQMQSGGAPLPMALEVEDRSVFVDSSEDYFDWGDSSKRSRAVGNWGNTVPNDQGQLWTRDNTNTHPASKASLAWEAKYKRARMEGRIDQSSNGINPYGAVGAHLESMTFGSNEMRTTRTTVDTQNPNILVGFGRSQRSQHFDSPSNENPANSTQRPFNN